MSKQSNISWASEQLYSKSVELGRMPKKDDFDEITRSKIKAFLGPWPRALETAGLKELKHSTVKFKKRKKSKKAKTKQITSFKKPEKKIFDENEKDK